jgi:hypothetical protein
VNPSDSFILWWYAWCFKTSAAEFWARSWYLVARELWLPCIAPRERTGKGLAQMYQETMRDTYGAEVDNAEGAS